MYKNNANVAFPYLELLSPLALDVPGPAGRALQRYLTFQRRFGKWTSIASFAALPAAAVLVFLFAASVSLCGEGCGFLSALFLIPLAYGALAAFVLAVAFNFAARALRRVRRDLVVTTAMRVQSLKDWFVRGDLTEAEYEDLKGRMMSIRDGTASHMEAEEAATFLRRLAVILCLTLAPAVLFLFITLLALTDGQIVALPFALVALLGAIMNATGIIYGFVRGRELQAISVRLGTALIREIDTTEAELLRTAHQRKTGASSSTPQPYRRASFRPFTGR